MKMEFDITKITEKIAMQAKENQEEFIIETIRPYCEDILQIKINKAELKQILLKGVQKQEPCEDCISRKAVLDMIDAKVWEFCDYLISKGRNDEQKPVSHFADDLRECIREDLPSATPQPKIGYCKDCKWWKDSDGVYRRDCYTESKCPMNRREVFEGNGYCYIFEPKMQEVEE